MGRSPLTLATVLLDGVGLNSKANMVKFNVDAAVPVR